MSEAVEEACSSYDKFPLYELEFMKDGFIDNCAGRFRCYVCNKITRMGGHKTLREHLFKGKDHYIVVPINHTECRSLVELNPLGYGL